MQNANGQIKIMIIDDHVVVREALKGMIETQKDLCVIGEAGDGREGVLMARQCLPDVVIMDISMPKLNGVEATRQLLAECPNVKVLSLSMHSDEAFVTEMLKAGACGFLVKHCNLSELLTAIRTIAGGKTYLSPSVAGVVVDGFLGRQGQPERAAFKILSPREREVLQLLAEGQSTREIAEQLNLSVSTVETHRRQLKEKLNIDSVAGLIKFAIREGLTTLDS